MRRTRDEGFKEWMRGRVCSEGMASSLSRDNGGQSVAFEKSLLWDPNGPSRAGSTTTLTLIPQSLRDRWGRTTYTAANVSDPDTQSRPAAAVQPVSGHHWPSPDGAAPCRDFLAPNDAITPSRLAGPSPNLTVALQHRLPTRPGPTLNLRGAPGTVGDAPNAPRAPSRPAILFCHGLEPHPGCPLDGLQYLTSLLGTTM